MWRLKIVPPCLFVRFGFFDFFKNGVAFVEIKGVGYIGICKLFMVNEI